MDRQIVRDNTSYEFTLDETTNYRDGVDASFNIDQHEGMTFLDFHYLSYTEANAQYLYMGDWYPVTISGTGTGFDINGARTLRSWEVVT